MKGERKKPAIAALAMASAALWCVLNVNSAAAGLFDDEVARKQIVEQQKRSDELRQQNEALAARLAKVEESLKTQPVLEAHARFMKANKEAKAILQGHADERGSREYNLALGQRRSESVFKAMNLLGVPEAQMEAVSMGEEKPIAEGHDEAAWQQNRRTEILYQGE